MANIGNLALKVTADPTGAVRDLTNLQRHVNKTVHNIGAATPPLTGFKGFIANIRQMFSKLNFASIFSGGGLSGMLVSGGGPFGAVIQGALAAANAIGRMVHQTAQLVDETAKLSDRLGVAFTDFQALAFAAQLAGVSQQELGQAMTIFSRTMGKASRGDSGAVEAFERLGLSGAQLAAMAPDQALIQVSAAMNRLGNEAERTAAAQELFGRGGASMLNFLESAHTQLEQARRDLEEFGGVLSREQAGGIEEMNDDVERLHASFQAIINQLTAGLAPIIGGIAEGLSHVVGAVNQILGPIFQLAGVLLTPFMEVLRILGMIFRNIGAAIKLFLAPFKPLLKLFGDMGGSVESLEPIFDAVFDTLTGMAEMVESIVDAFIGPIVSTIRDIVSSIGEGLAGFASWFGELTGIADILRQIQEMTSAAPGEVFGVSSYTEWRLQLEEFMIQLDREMEQLGNQMAERFGDPLNAVIRQTTELRDLFSGGFINQDVFSRGMADAVTQLERFVGTAQIRLPAALEAGSSGAISAINQFRVQSEGSQNPQERMVQLLQQAERQRQEQLQYERQQADLLRQLLEGGFSLGPAGV